MRSSSNTLLPIAAFAVAVLLASPGTADPLYGRWDQFAPPTPRSGHVAVYDPVRDRVIVVGGSDGTDRIDVWSIELGTGASWKNMKVVGIPPSGRHNHSAIYDPVGDRIILFGGAYGPGGLELNDLWALNLSGTPSWTWFTPAGTLPQPRAYHTAIYDPLRHRMIVFGGRRGSFSLNDVYALDLAGAGTWSPLAAGGTPPPQIAGASAIYDPPRDRMIVFGGYDNNSTPRNDTWSLSFAGAPAWTSLSPSGTLPPARRDHTCIYDSQHERMVIFAGAYSPSRNDVWVLELSGVMTWNSLAPATTPRGRADASAVYDPLRKRMIVFGGADGTALLNDVPALALDGALAWSDLLPVPQAPSPRSSASAVFDPVRNRFLVFGGGYGAAGVLNDVWALDVTAQPIWTRIVPAGTPPPPRSSHAAIYDPTRDRMVVFGGWSGLTVLNDTWELDLATTTWSNSSPAGTLPPGRYACSAIFDAPRDRMVVFGGRNLATGRNDTWSLAFAGTPTWSELTPAGTLPPIRSLHSAVDDVPRDRMVIYGGHDGATIYNDLWSLNLVGVPSWTPITPAGPMPTAHYAHQAIYDPLRERMVTFGGWSGAYRNDSWSFDLAGAPAWSWLAPEGPLPAARVSHAAAYDSRSDRMIVFGGSNGFTLTNDVCQLIWSSVVAVDPVPAEARFELGSPAPNPFRNGTRCAFVLPQATRVTLAVFDVTGRRVRGLVEGSFAAGPHAVEWDRRDERGVPVRAGIYFLRMDTPGVSLVEKLVTF
jgi:hypothetical protein